MPEPEPPTPTRQDARRGSGAGGLGNMANGLLRGRKSSGDKDEVARRKGSEDLESSVSVAPGLSPAGGDDDRKQRWERVRDMAFPKRSHNAPATGAGHSSDKPALHNFSLPVLLPDGRFRRVWDTILIAALLYSFMTVPYYIAWDTQASGGLDKFEIFLDVFFIIDLILNFRTALMKDLSNDLETDGKTIAVTYLKGWFIIDLLSCVPFDSITAAVGGDIAGLTFIKVPRMLRLLRLFRLIRFIMGGSRSSLMEKILESLQISTVLLRIAKLFFWIALVAHINACVIFFVARAEGFPPNSWVYSLDSEFDPTAPSFDSYIMAFYFVFTTMATVGFGDITPGNTTERLIVIFIEFSGSITYGFVVGGIGQVVQQLNRNQTKYQQEMDAISEYMRYRDLPRELQQRIKDYFEYIMTKQLLFDEKLILSKLSTSLRTEVCLYLNRDIIEKTPFFKGKDSNFVAAVVTSLRPMSVAPGDYIFRYGETGREMYILSRGRVEVVGPENKRYNVLEAGSYFGEVSLLLGVKRTASTRALGNCDLFALTKEDLDRATEDYPREKKKLEDIARSRVAQLQVDDRKKELAPPPPPPAPEEPDANGGPKTGRSSKSRQASMRRRRRGDTLAAGDAAALADEVRRARDDGGGGAAPAAAALGASTSRRSFRAGKAVLANMFKKVAGAIKRPGERPGEEFAAAVEGAVERAVRLGALPPRHRDAGDEGDEAGPAPRPAGAGTHSPPLSERRGVAHALPLLELPGAGRARRRPSRDSAPGQEEGGPAAPRPGRPGAEPEPPAPPPAPAVSMTSAQLPPESPAPPSDYGGSVGGSGGGGPSFYVPLHAPDGPAASSGDERASSPQPPSREPDLSALAHPTPTRNYPVPGSVPPPLNPLQKLQSESEDDRTRPRPSIVLPPIGVPPLAIG
eukprot:tig00000711_g3420.t1